MNIIKLDESTLKWLIHKNNWHFIKRLSVIVLKSVLVFLCLLGVGYFAYNFNGLLEKARYFWRYQILMEPQPRKKVVAKYFLPEIKKTQELVTPLSETEDSLLIIPRINQKLPVIWDSPGEGKEMFKNLKKGVIHLIGSAKPDEIGNVVIAGHSSSAIWDKNPYGKAFANLNKLQIGDLIELHFNRKAYFYEVTKVFVTNKDDLSVLNKTEQPSLTLITCTPIGTAEKRLIVKARMVDGNPMMKKQKTKPLINLLPQT